MPLTDRSEIPPQRASARNDVSIRGRISQVINRFTTSTTNTGTIAIMNEGERSLW